MVKCGVVLAAMVCGVLVYGSRRAFAVEGVVNASYGVVDKCILMFGNAWPKTLWPWKVRELSEKEPENGVFRLLRNDVTWFLTTILIGTAVVNIGATALVTEAATAIFGEAGVGAATGVMTVLILLLTEITPKSVSVHNPQKLLGLCERNLEATSSGPLLLPHPSTEDCTVNGFYKPKK